MALFLLCPNLGWIQGQFNFYRTFVTLPKGMISKGVLSSISLILPPVEIQDSFASIAQQIEEIRNQQHESTYEVSSLLNALMSKAFIGELISN